MKERRSTVSTDHGATGEAATSIQMMEAGETTKNSNTTDTDVYLKRILTFVLVLFFVLFILSTITSVISIISKF